MLFIVVAPVLTIQHEQTFSLPGATLLFGDYNELNVVTPGGSHVLTPPSNEPYNRGYFVAPSITASGDAIAWGFATRWTGRRARFALGLYSVQKKTWQTHGDFDRLKAVAFSPSGNKVAMLAVQPQGKPALLILDVATGAITEGPYQRGMWATLSWAPDEKRLVADLDRGGDSAAVAIVDLKVGAVRVIGKGFGARWSPDGQWIAYYPSVKKCAVVRPDGTGFRTVMTPGSGKEFVTGAPVWSPDGKQLLLNVSKNDRALLDVVLLDLATDRTVTQSVSGLPVYGWASYRE